MGNTIKRCFVIMPFGKKKDIQLDESGKQAEIDFDEIYEFLIAKAIREDLRQLDPGLQLECVRCDQVAESGWIHDRMIKLIYECDVAIVDITTLNANVFYELGVRDALKCGVTVLIRKQGTRLPFDLAGLTVLSYDTGLSGAAQSARAIAEFVRNGLANPRPEHSLVHKVLPDLTVQRGAPRKPQVLDTTEIYPFRLNKVPAKTIALITGDVRNIKLADVWVNSENTNMQMARFFDRSVSGLIRYMGAKKDENGEVIEDIIANELAEKMKGKNAVIAGSIVVTPAGELEAANNVKRIFHAAAVYGEIGTGYVAISNIETCVTNALGRADTLAAKGTTLKSMLFPLMGTGAGRGNVQENAFRLMRAAVAYLENNPASAVDTVYFVARTDMDLDVCLESAARLPVTPAA